MNIPIVTIMLLQFLSCAIQAQELTGQVVDQNSGRPLSYVNIGIQWKNVGTITNEQGNCRLSLHDKAILPNDTLIFSMIGYKRKKFIYRSVEVPGTLDVTLEETPVLLEPIEVKGQNLKPVKKGSEGFLDLCKQGG